jgi:beta-glucanase (GH16 family)
MQRLFVILATLAILTLTGFKSAGPVPHTHVNTAADSCQWETVIDSRSFASYRSFESKWNYLYPWGSDHNGSARMIAGKSNSTYVSLKNKVLHIKAKYISSDEGKSDKNPHLKIKYLSGAIHAKHQVEVTDTWTQYEISGSFKAPIDKGTWPAFWITAVKGWPPESDILEYKGDNVNWQNTFITPSNINTTKIIMADANTKWHHYKAVLKKVNTTEVDIYYYIDQKLTGVHRGNFMNKPLWIIINLQMEGSAGEPGPTADTDYYIKDILVKRSRQC